MVIYYLLSPTHSWTTTCLVLQFAEFLFALFALALVWLLGIFREFLHIGLHLQQRLNANVDGRGIDDGMT